MVGTRGKGIIYLFITVFLWSTIEVVSKPLNGRIDPLWIAFLRFFIGGVFLMPLVFIHWRKMDRKNVKAGDWAMFVLLSFLGITAAFILFHEALVGISATAAATLISTTPLFIAPLSLVFLKEKMGYLGLVGIFIGAIGIFVLIVFQEHHEIRLLSAPIMILISVILFSVYSVGMKSLNERMNARITTPLSLFIGALMMLPIIAIKGTSFTAERMTVLAWAGIFYLGVVAVGLAYLLYFIGLESMEVSRGSSFIYLKPTIAALLAWPILSEVPSLLSVVSIVLISFSVYIVVAEAGIKRILKWKNGPE